MCTWKLDLIYSLKQFLTAKAVAPAHPCARDIRTPLYSTKGTKVFLIKHAFLCVLCAFAVNMPLFSAHAACRLHSTSSTMPVDILNKNP